jgi:hypothetical protein
MLLTPPTAAKIAATYSANWLCFFGISSDMSSSTRRRNKKEFDFNKLYLNSWKLFFIWHAGAIKFGYPRESGTPEFFLLLFTQFPF